MENTELAIEAEETKDTAAPGAIDVSDKGVIKFEDRLKNSLPAIPSTLVINGLEVNNDKLKETIEKQVKTMKINGLGDKEGFDIAEAKLKELSKLRTSSGKWRTTVTAPLLKFQKDLKSSVDKIGEMCTEGEEYLESILKPIRDAVEIARQQEEERKDRQAEVRAEYIVSIGGVLEKGTYKFPYDGGLFILASSLRALSDEDYEKELVDINAAWEVEKARLKQIEDEKDKEQKLLLSQLEDLNAERTELRREQLDGRGYEYSEAEGGCYYKNGVLQITEDELLNSNAADWKELLNPAIPQPAMEDVSDMNTTIAQDQEFADGVPAGTYTIPVTAPVNKQPVSFSPPAELSEEATAVPVEEIKPQPATEDVKVLTRSLVFSSAKPFIDLPMSSKRNIRVFPSEFSEVALKDQEVAYTGTISEGLQYSFVTIKE